MMSHSYVVVEAAALVHRRLGAQANRVLFESLLPAMSVFFVDETLHGRAVAAFLAALRRRGEVIPGAFVTYDPPDSVEDLRAFHTGIPAGRMAAWPGARGKEPYSRRKDTCGTRQHHSGAVQHASSRQSPTFFLPGDRPRSQRTPR